MEKRLLKTKDLWTPIFSVLGFFYSLNASLHLLPEAGATQERRLEAVRCKALFGKALASWVPDSGVPRVPIGSPHRPEEVGMGASSSPSALAVLRLMISSNFVGRSTGRSAGLAPLRILSTNTAARRQPQRGSDSFGPYVSRPPSSAKRL